ncbi:uncharacterized protein F4822DRAFT_436235 [Hypoxylon trugodes]|uniref:uncharacterized protein n=1 Tax=Hypoxylon trugodes TaxID=326681 RepID=UPI0021969D1D|nr:uncharacterized protein F4822DRAFT_436235 [Hypoxylon trugodes]KAI1392460.1 hypothetical protein F4822DRAFT_436235 [Hypoxylon trugodes]
MGRGPELHKTLSSVLSISTSETIMPDDETHGVLGLTTLHEPPPPNKTLADIVFVHGLGGGSRKTWSYSPSKHHYWPQAWLANDPDFVDIRIHSFGYKSEWAERQRSILDIRDFAESLVGGLKNNPGIRRSSTRIIFVCHSMGGCVAKKAYIMTRQDPSCKDLADRIHSIFFLGTPHRGSDLAAILKRLSILAWGSKPFVSDLIPNSSTLRDINDTFRHYASNLRLWSFYETLPARPRILNKIVVERHSATLGYPNEEIIAMNADHRQLCKFSSPADPNYRILRNALHTVTDMLRSLPSLDLTCSQTYVQLTSAQQNLNQKSARQRLSSFLGVTDAPEDELQTLQLLQHPGSCRWFTEAECFISWKTNRSPGILWLTGRPGFGKSVLSSHVVEQVESADSFCSYFFFKQREASKSTLSDCLRSLLFQMAIQDSQMADKLFEIEAEYVTWDLTDELSLWRKLFVNGIFKLPSISRHFWIIDGVDECVNFNSLFTKRILATVPEGLHFFATSRHLDEIRRGLASIGSLVCLQSISETDTLSDMRLLVHSKLRELDRLENDESVHTMCEKIIEKSSGSFLWVRLVLQEFGNVWTSEAMDAILDEIPIDLQDMYCRMLQSIEKNKRTAKLAKSILSWAISACRPLTATELRVAVKLDINETLQNISKAVPSLCHQLVSVDSNDRVYILHATAREFLLNNDLHPEFIVHSIEKHAYIGSLLLQYLLSNASKLHVPLQQQNSGFRGFAKPTDIVASEPSMLDYATSFFSEHVYRGISRDDILMAKLCTFVKGGAILSWIEYVARYGSLGDITRTAINLREYLEEKARYLPLMDPSAYLVGCWVTDLIRVAAKFRSQLLVCPSSIHYIIPLFCPSDSIISRTFVNDAKSSKITIKGIPPASWDDCLTHIDFERGRATAVSCDAHLFAVGLSTGQISLFNAHSIQHVASIAHPERVRMLRFSTDGEFLASSGTKTLVVWQLKSRTQKISFPLESQLIAFTFLGGDEFLCAFASGELTKWRLDSDQHDDQHETISWRGGYAEDIADNLGIPKQPPGRAAFSTAGDAVLLAVGYRRYPIFIWNAFELRLLGQCGDAENNGIDDMIFNPNPDTPELIVSYNDGRLCLFNYHTLTPTFNQSNVFAHSIACSPDGRNLIAGSTKGLKIFKFSQDHIGNTILIPIYSIQSPDESIRSVAFSADGLRCLDIHDEQCRVWAPTALIRKDNELGSVDAVPLSPKIARTTLGPEIPEITSALVVSSSTSCVIAGKSNGELGVLYDHGRGVSIVNVALDDAGRVLVAELSIATSSVTQGLPSAHVVLDRKFGASIINLLVNPSADRLLICGRHTDELCDLPSGRVFSPIVLSDSLAAATALQHPTNESWFVLMSANARRIFCWSDFQELATTNDILEEPSTFVESPLSQPLPATKTPSMRGSSYSVGQDFVLELRKVSRFTPPQVYAWPAQTFDPTTPLSASQASPTEVDLAAIGTDIMTVLGVVGKSTVLFMDANLWVYSMELRLEQSEPYARASLFGEKPVVQDGSKPPTQQVLPIFIRRHFFALSEWCTDSGELRCIAAQHAEGTKFFFASRQHIVVVRRGLEFWDTVIGN